MVKIFSTFSIPKGEHVCTRLPTKVSVASLHSIPNFDHLLPRFKTIMPLSTPIKKLFFTHEFNESVISLPASVTQLVFGREGVSGLFNQKIDRLPFCLSHLSLSFHFNQPVDFFQFPC